ncbi:MAG: hypothetical protein H9535_03225 [Ignavibacteria bacterium]|nr:hypothetical protein [Ignavibacteria bacterium]
MQKRVLVLLLLLFSSIFCGCSSKSYRYEVISRLPTKLQVNFTHAVDGKKSFVVSGIDTLTNTKQSSGYVTAGEDKFTAVDVILENRVIYSASPLKKEDWFQWGFQNGISGLNESVLYINSIFVGFTQMKHDVIIIFDFTDSTKSHTIIFSNSGLPDTVVAKQGQKYASLPPVVITTPSNMVLTAIQAKQDIVKNILQKVKLFDGYGVLMFSGESMQPTRWELEGRASIGNGDTLPIYHRIYIQQ